MEILPCHNNRVTPAAGHWSRSVDRRYTLPNPRLEPAAFVSGLAAIAAEGEHAVLIPGVDAALLAVSEHRDENLVRSIWNTLFNECWYLSFLPLIGLLTWFLPDLRKPG